MSTTGPIEPGLGLGTRYNSGRISRNAAIIELALSFPRLKSHMLGMKPETWDIERFMRDLGMLSSGERHAKLFIAAVWDSSWPAANGMKFNVVDAVSIWDAAHRKAFIQWAGDPFWP